MIESVQNDIARHKKHIAKLKSLLQDIPPVRDLEAERREQQRLADQQAASQRQAQEQQQERARQFEAATAKQFQKQERAEGIANALMQGFNNMQERNRKWEDMQDARREREAKEEREERAYQLARQQEAANSAPATQYAQPPPVAPDPVPEPYVPPYTPPSLGGYLSDDAKQFGAEVVVETATILGGELWGQATEGNPLNLRNAAASGINNLAGNTFDAIVDDTVDSIKDTAYNTFMSLLPEQKQQDIRALQMPLSFISLRWDNVKDAYFGPYSTWQKDFVEPFNSFSSYLWED